MVGQNKFLQQMGRTSLLIFQLPPPIKWSCCDCSEVDETFTTIKHGTRYQRNTCAVLQFRNTHDFVNCNSPTEVVFGQQLRNVLHAHRFSTMRMYDPIGHISESSNVQIASHTRRTSDARHICFMRFLQPLNYPHQVHQQ